MFHAINHGQKAFEVVENVDTRGELPERPSYKDITSTAKYNATARYKMHHDVNYISLDDPVVADLVKDVTANAVIYCGDAKVGDFVVGSTDGEWAESHSTAQWRQHTLSDNGLVFSRVVEATRSVNVGQATCLLLGTRDIPAIKLFQHFKMETLSQQPFSHYHFAPGTEPSSQSYNGGGPDAPAVACIPGNFRPGGVLATDDYKASKVGSSGDDYTVISGGSTLTSSNNGCASINLNLANLISDTTSINLSEESFNYNYNPTTGEAQSTYSIGEGLTCSNCYAYREFISCQ